MFEKTRLSLFSRKNLLSRTVAHHIPEITKYRDISGCSIYPTTFMRSELDRKHNKDYKDNRVLENKQCEFLCRIIALFSLGTLSLTKFAAI